MRVQAVLLLPFLLASCTTVRQTMRLDGSREYLIACGASTGWDICYGKAESLCPTGYETLSEEGRFSFDRKELRIVCAAQQAPAAEEGP